MTTFLISLSFYPYYRLPSTGEIKYLTIDQQKSYLSAQKEDILNDILWSAIYFKMKDLNKCLAPDIPTRGTPKRLGQNTFNKITGEIYYPDALIDDSFVFYCSVLNNKIQDFCCKEKTFSNYINAQKSIDSFQQFLKRYYESNNQDQYFCINNFLRSLEYELRLLI